MMAHVAQFVCSVQGQGFDDWANILFLVAMAVLWLLAGLVKTVSKKGPQANAPEPKDLPKERRGPGETWQERLARKAEELQRRWEEEAGLREPGQRPPRPATRVPRPAQPPSDRIQVRTDRGGESVVIYKPPQSSPSTQREHQAAQQREAQRAVSTAGQYASKQTLEVETPVKVTAPKLEPVMEDLSHIMAEPPKSLEQLRPPRDSAGFELTAVIDYSDPDALKKAILHYEVLAKPLALRDAPDRTSIF